MILIFNIQDVVILSQKPGLPFTSKCNSCKLLFLLQKQKNKTLENL